jgi:hypothetical protein
MPAFVIVYILEQKLLSNLTAHSELLDKLRKECETRVNLAMAVIKMMTEN